MIHFIIVYCQSGKRSSQAKEQLKELGYKKIYLKSDLINYYEKFNAKYIETLNNGEKLFYIDL